MDAVSEERMWGKAAVVCVLAVIVATVIYFVVPVPRPANHATWVLLFAVGGAVLACLIALTINRLLHADREVRAGGLIVLLCVSVLFFSWADASLATLSGQFAELHDRTDALYFNVTTLATVGFGDVHATGQLARAAVTLQIVFNLVFLGTAVAQISGILRARASRHRAGRQASKAAGAEPDSKGPNSGA
jgi:hypothetical protein